MDCHSKKNVCNQQMGERVICWFMKAPGVEGGFAHPNQFVAATESCRASPDNAFSCCADAAERAMQSKKSELVQAVQDAYDTLFLSVDEIIMLKAVALKRELER